MEGDSAWTSRACRRTAHQQPEGADTGVPSVHVTVHGYVQVPTGELACEDCCSDDERLDDQGNKQSTWSHGQRKWLASVEAAFDLDSTCTCGKVLLVYRKNEQSELHTEVWFRVRMHTSVVPRACMYGRIWAGSAVLWPFLSLTTTDC